MDGEVKVAINYDRVADDSKWDGLKGYLTNTDIPIQDVYTAYHNLWHVERAFRIAKSKIEIRPMFHFTRRRIEAHICICFVALKVYKELERKVVGITATMLTKCLRELEQDGFITRTQYNTIPPRGEYALAERGKMLISALESVYQWAEAQMK